MPASLRSLGIDSQSPTTVVDPTNLSPTLPPQRRRDDVLLLWTTCRNPVAACATPAGWTPLVNVAGANGRMVLLARLVDGTETAPTIVWSGMVTGAAGDPSVVRMGAIEGLLTDLSAIVDVVGTAQDQASSTTLAAGGNSITTTTPDTMVVSFQTRQDDAGNFTNPIVIEGLRYPILDDLATNHTTHVREHIYWTPLGTPGTVPTMSVVIATGVAAASSAVLFALKCKNAASPGHRMPIGA